MFVFFKPTFWKVTSKVRHTPVSIYTLSMNQANYPTAQASSSSHTHVSMSQTQDHIQYICLDLQGQCQQTFVFTHVSFSTQVCSLRSVDTELPPSQTDLLSYLSLQVGNSYRLNENLQIPSSTVHSIIKLYLVRWMQIYKTSSCIYIKALTPSYFSFQSPCLLLPSLRNILKHCKDTFNY